MTGTRRCFITALAGVMAVTLWLGGSWAGSSRALASGAAGTLTWSRLTLLDAQRSLTISAVSCAGQTFCAAVAGYSVLTYNGKSWSKPDTVVPATTVSAGLDGISCPTASFCVATGSSLTGGPSVRGDYAIVFRDGRWGTPVRLSPAADGGASVSCASASFCMAVTRSGTAFEFDATSWSAGTSLDAPVLSVSCPTSAFCAAVGGGSSALTYSAGVWSTADYLGTSTSELSSVSCASADMCVAVGSAAGGLPAVYTTYNGSVWVDLIPATAEGAGPAVVSCPASRYCLGIDTTGQSWQFDGELWDSQVTFDTGLTTGSLSCPSTLFCMASAARGTVQELQAYDAGPGWQPPVVVAYPTGPPVAASCPAPGICTVLDEQGNTYRYSRGAWHWSPALSRVTSGHLGSLSCPTTSFCLVTGDYLYTYSWNGRTWTAAEPFTGMVFGPGGTMSCASPSFCVAVDSYGNASVRRGQTWSQATAVGSGQYGLSAVTCPAPGFCAAGGDDSAEFTFSNRSWSGPLLLEKPTSVNTITGMSCATRTYCVAVDGSGYAIEFNAQTMSAARPVRLSRARLLAVSCPRAGLCVAVGAKGRIFTLAGGRWQKTGSVGTDQVLDSVSCASASFCVAVTESGDVLAGT